LVARLVVVDHPTVGAQVVAGLLTTVAILLTLLRQAVYHLQMAEQAELLPHLQPEVLVAAAAHTAILAVGVAAVATVVEVALVKAQTPPTVAVEEVMVLVRYLP
jgi:hypothetical protein